MTCKAATCHMCGSHHFAETVREIRRALPDARVEALTPDFCGDRDAVARVLDAGPHVFNHNMETVPRLYRRVRPQANYRRSLAMLAFARKPPKPDVDRRPTVAPPLSPPTPQPMSVALSAALPPLPPNVPLFDVLTHRFSTRVAGAGDETIDAAVHLMRTGSRSVLFGTLAVVALVGVFLGRHR